MYWVCVYFCNIGNVEIEMQILCWNVEIEVQILWHEIQL